MLIGTKMFITRSSQSVATDCCPVPKLETVHKENFTPFTSDRCLVRQCCSIGVASSPAIFGLRSRPIDDSLPLYAVRNSGFVSATSTVSQTGSNRPTQQQSCPCRDYPRQDDSKFDPSSGRTWIFLREGNAIESEPNHPSTRERLFVKEWKIQQQL
mmetsp:Transcript_35067/g.73035  ORF Transcript_35067/g.73035 Transcript_35067/m.73035 type:complete len:156 (-) Transcript_35067:350-817(-)